MNSNSNSNGSSSGGSSGGNSNDELDVDLDDEDLDDIAFDDEEDGEEDGEEDDKEASTEEPGKSVEQSSPKESKGRKRKREDDQEEEDDDDIEDDKEGDQETSSTSALYPFPPPYYKSYGKTGTGRPMAGAVSLAPPNIPTQGEYSCFGETRKLDEQTPSLEDWGRKQLFQEPVHYGNELRKLCRLAFKTFSELLGVLGSGDHISISQMTQRGFDASTELETVAVNMMYLLNEYRPHQARETLVHFMKRQIEARKSHASWIREVVASGKAKLKKAAHSSQERTASGGNNYNYHHRGNGKGDTESSSSSSSSSTAAATSETQDQEQEQDQDQARAEVPSVGSLSSDDPAIRFLNSLHRSTSTMF